MFDEFEVAPEFAALEDEDTDADLPEEDEEELDDDELDADEEAEEGV